MESTHTVGLLQSSKQAYPTKKEQKNNMKASSLTPRKTEKSHISTAYKDNKKVHNVYKLNT